MNCDRQLDTVERLRREVGRILAGDPPTECASYVTNTGCVSV